MAVDVSDGLLSQYMAELAYLSHAGASFARRHPHVAAALELAQNGSADPHVQRLIESFAFLTARLQRSYDAQLPEVPAALLDVLYPQLAAPVPSMSVAQFTTNPAQSRAASGIVVPAGTSLLASAEGLGEGVTCRFRTGMPVTLWPIEVENAWLESPSIHPALDGRPDVERVLRIRLRCQGHRRFDELSPTSLRFFLPPSAGGRDVLHEALFTRLIGVAVAPIPDAQIMSRGPSPVVTWLPEAALRQVGFAAEEGLLPWPAGAHQAYRLLAEYFHFPDKFQFFDVGPLPSDAFGADTRADLLLLLRAAPRLRVQINANSFLLGCTPIINLFQRLSEPIRVDHTRLDHPLIADLRRSNSTQIYSIDQVIAADGSAERGRAVPPLFAVRGSEPGSGENMHYVARRVHDRPWTSGGLAAEPAGGDFMLSFVDRALDLNHQAQTTVFARVTCTNRGAAELLEQGSRFALEVDLPVSGVINLMRPTPQTDPIDQGAALWRLVSHLSANHVSATSGEDGTGLGSLRALWSIYRGGGETGPASLADGFTSLETRRVVRQIGTDAWRGFCRGVEVTLTFDETRVADPGVYLFGCVLSRYFGLTTSVNSFAELVIILKGRQHDEVWRWPAMTGDTPLL